MALKVDYYTTLSRAVAALDRDSYAARGAVYDREHKALLRRLFSADPPHADEDIEREQQAFRAAVRRIEFGDDDHEHVPLVPQREAAHDEPAAAPAITPPTPAATAPVPPARVRRAERDWTPEPVAWSGQQQPAARESQRVPRAPAAEASPGPATPGPGHWSQRKGSPEAAPPPAQWSQRKQSQTLPWRELEATVETALKGQAVLPPPPAALDDGAAVPDVEKLKRKPIVGRIVRRTLLAAMLLGLGIVGYGFATGDVELPDWTKFASKNATAAKPVATAGSQAVIFDSNPPNTEGSKGVGTAVWRVRSEPASPQRAASTVLQFDLKIPDRQLNLTMSMRPEAPGSAMSHLIELRFLNAEGQPDPDVDNIASIVMTSVEQQRPRVLVGRVQKVAPGVFYIGLSGQTSDREQNLRFLKEETWFDVPLTYRNGASGVLAIEKGADGERAVNEAVGEWGRVAAAPSDR